MEFGDFLLRGNIRNKPPQGQNYVGEANTRL